MSPFLQMDSHRLLTTHPSRNEEGTFSLTILSSSRWLRRLLFRLNLRYLIANLRRVDDELERIKFLVFLHELQVGEPFELIEGLACRESAPGPFERSGREFELPICDHPPRSLGQLSL